MGNISGEKIGAGYRDLSVIIKGLAMTLIMTLIKRQIFKIII